ncbi:methylcrotonoyl-CoA carboxylase [Citromicrobium sp. RCC1885]|uniref:acetyl/propionyl/methylcrotonyl-CoA carboxylase subunit alpha n=1 Tax=unclassified Citromicrobium TaxID=2630544 RepID=UPI0006C8F1F5|nr:MULTISPECIES: acetyl/propionyl/methylcrotonyl-CoA carboxylase subunit alpha [unclassified Citromicrobium]KPM22120.1 methylcrotonoyl-CoA carboxylase [Citromicrobium sp. RCC1885]KPM24147.1 methylcrotonoyl-CoA carboxylase [Citromicrobium sp. RCC1878]MAO04482.1 acetyl/propionyl/methylcrotonyl-CoA carboxylase subunit alpha [Citromicrobium sp.]OAM07434.1 methylcrotonoyl-CoA carboxylase [Citromicrobium sp. RCC1897]|tara:strand:+ start:303 stop:2174 length:1872 start_codon:yes stop_codon:yes gene_type:complete
MIQKLLIANRGEIACRIIRTAREMGIATVAVYSDADAKALHVRSADEAVHIGPSPAAESYLVGEKIIAAAKQTGAQAIHPGYGFLSENADFAQAVKDAGLIWVGAPPSSIRAMGLKDAAKKLMREAGVPVTPGYDGDDQSPERLKQEADAIGYPVLIKAVAGGGGKGMRKVDAEGDFLSALESCRREAKASFGNDDVILEKWITSPRHIEVQVFGDSHGNHVHLFERDCSLQRRHQKVIEEAPAPGMDEATREEICAAAVRAAKAVDYEGAGTIEFIADASEGLRADRIFFMEMNTRLQVEHPVTEEITGVDLVEWQLLVAAGEPIPLEQDELFIDGHAIEARLYAEDPSSGFLPSTGSLDHFDIGLRGRIETGVEEGDQISPFYDPMVAKLVTWADTREDAIEQLAEIADGVEIWPVRTNAAFIANCLRDEDFEDANLDTGFIERKIDDLVESDEPYEAIWQTAADFVVLAETDDYDDQPAGFRLNAPGRLTTSLSFKGDTRVVAAAEGAAFEAATGFVDPHRVVVFADGMSFAFDRGSRGSGAAAAGDGAILAPMPGKVIALDVAEGDSVTAGQRLMVLEAMKMEHSLTAPFDGTVTQLSASEGGQVQVEAVLCVVEPSEG